MEKPVLIQADQDGTLATSTSRRRIAGRPRMKLNSMQRALRRFALVAGLTMVIGSSWMYWGNHMVSPAGGIAAVGPSQGAGPQAQKQRKEEIDRLFFQGVALLNARKYEAASSEFQHVRDLAPLMPEAHANLGFSLLGSQRYQMAKVSFEAAIEVRRDQLNAYFGLAMAQEGLRDLRGALGAMRTYVHLSKADDPYVRKANAAIWEWEEELKKTGSNATVPPGKGLPVNEKNAAVDPIPEKNRFPSRSLK